MGRTSDRESESPSNLEEGLLQVEGLEASRWGLRLVGLEGIPSAATGGPVHLVPRWRRVSGAGTVSMTPVAAPAYYRLTFPDGTRGSTLYIGAEVMSGHDRGGTAWRVGDERSGHVVPLHELFDLSEPGTYRVEWAGRSDWADPAPEPLTFTIRSAPSSD